MEESDSFGPEERVALLQEMARVLRECVLRDLDADQILRGILQGILQVVPFKYATISIVDYTQRVIETRHGIWEGQIDRFPEWIHSSRYTLDEPDIQADIVRTGRTEVLSDWDPRFNKAIWDTYEHHKLIRVFVPVRGIDGTIVGTIEAGFDKATKPHISAEEVKKLESFSAEAAVGIHVSQYVAALVARKEREAATNGTVERERQYKAFGRAGLRRAGRKGGAAALGADTLPRRPASSVVNCPAS
jgi:hypothetical protein